MAARRAAFGHVRKLPSGRYQARFTVPGSVCTEYVNAPSTFATKASATLWLAKQRTLIAEGKIDPTTVNIAFGDYAQTWLAGRRLKSSTRVLYDRQLQRALLPKWGGWKLREITPAQVRAWYTTLLPDKPTERAHLYGLLRTILITAWREDLISSSPCRIAGAGTSRRAKAIRPASLAELQVLAAHIEEPWRPMILLGAWCALRFGEVTELRRHDISLADGVVRVERGVTWLTGAPVVDTPKTEAGARDVVIPPHLLPMLTEHLAKFVGPEPTALLFPVATGGDLQISPHRFRSHFTRAKVAAGRPDLTFHALRHTGAVLAAASGATVAELMARLGHTSAQMAMRYQHAAADRDRVIAEALSRLATAG
ncbi:tyrosine-type recombinase/integrase [Pengzhenrongella phosphoraccumulans]|uniref:tyrosine-type recombinase/integrase n=1 Tax=Pengzhenrongella phosphoraccumulans TaxID=3114394 RepID=UPI00388E24D2